LRFILDTDIISQATKMQPNASVLRWLQSVKTEDICLSVITIQEIRAGIELMPPGARRAAVEQWLLTDVLRGFEDRILDIDTVIADECGGLVATARKQGHTPDLGDVLIAATAKLRGLKVATLNRKHFEKLGVELVDFSSGH
jgi:toxin FitB